MPIRAERYGTFGLDEYNPAIFSMGIDVIHRGVRLHDSRTKSGVSWQVEWRFYVTAEQDAMAIPHTDQRLVVTPRRLGLPSRGPTFLPRGFSCAFLGQVPFNLEYRASRRVHDLTSQAPARIEFDPRDGGQVVTQIA